MSVQFPRVVRVFPARSLALFNRERSVRYSAGLNAVKDSVRPGDGQRIQQRSKRLIVTPPWDSGPLRGCLELKSRCTTNPYRQVARCARLLTVASSSTGSTGRSEERRVGKE